MCLRRNSVNGRLLVSMPSSKHAPGVAHAKRLLSIAYSASNQCLNLLMASPLEAAIRWRALEAPLGIVSGRLLIIGAHPDDETLGCGAIASEILKKGGSVCVVIATEGEASRSYSDRHEMVDIRRAEASSAADTLGIGAENVHWLNLLDGDLSSHEAEMTSVLQGLVEVWEPNVVLTNASSDPHPDHAAVGRATRRALSVTHPALFEYMIWGWYQPWSWLRSLAAARDIPASGAELPFSAVQFRSLSGLECKRRALSCYLSQLAPTAVKMDLPAGTGMLSHRFLAHFLKTSEVIFPVNTAARELIKSSLDAEGSENSDARSAAGESTGMRGQGRCPGRRS